MGEACPKCNGKMVPGDLTFLGKGLVGFKSEYQTHLSYPPTVKKASACVECGYLELYVDTKHLFAKR